VYAEQDTRQYPTGVKVSDKDRKKVWFYWLFPGIPWFFTRKLLPLRAKKSGRAAEPCTARP